jgi:predicted dehydrogenase
MVVVGRDQMLQFDDAATEEPVKIFDMGVEADVLDARHEPTYRQGDIISPAVGSQQPVARQLRHFHDASQGLHPLTSDGWFGVSVVKALEAADLSWRTGGEPIEFAVDNAVSSGSDKVVTAL